MNFQEKLAHKNTFVVTLEFGPPKGVNVASRIEEFARFKGMVDAVNVTDMQSSVMRLGGLASSYLLLQKGLEVIYQVTCRDRNRLALQSDLLSAHVLGRRDVLVLTGDYPTRGDHPDAKPVFDLDAVQLIHVVGQLNKGHDMQGHKLDGKTDFFVGAVVNPFVEPLEPEILKMKKKVDAGCRFFQTQAVYDVEKFKRFLDVASKIEAPILAGIIPLRSEKMARYMNENVAGISVPEGLIGRIAHAHDKKAAATEIAVSTIQELRSLVRGIHLMPIGWLDVVPGILNAV